MALDPSAMGGEISTSVEMLFKSLRSRGFMADDWLGVERVEKIKPRNIFPNWGKHAGKAFRDIPPDYFTWIVRKWYPNLDDEGKQSWKYLLIEINQYLADLEKAMWGESNI